jgi:hypothetical protein
MSSKMSEGSEERTVIKGTCFSSFGDNSNVACARARWYMPLTAVPST